MENPIHLTKVRVVDSSASRIGGTASDPDDARSLRSDAQLNRDRIVEVAIALFAERGPEVSMASIARHAGVGVATLYRRFPTKESLVSEVFADQFMTCLATVEEALTDPDPWQGFCWVVEKVCVMQAVNRGFASAFLAAFPEAVDVARVRDQAVAGFTELVRRAQRTGQLRADFAPGDLPLLLMANAGIVAESPEATAAASRRLVGFLLDSFRADRSVPMPLPPPVPLDLLDAV